MTARNPSRLVNSASLAKQGDMAPPPAFEYAFYLVFFYANLSVPLGVSIPLLGAAMVAALAAWCLQSKWRRVITGSIRWPLAWVLSLVAIQVLIHGESIMDSGLRNWITMGFVFILVQTLALRRGFLHRSAIVYLIIGLLSLPLFAKSGGDEAQRLSLDYSAGASGMLSNANSLAAYFGFLGVYFIVYGLEKKRDAARLLSWAIAAACLVVMAMTVGRGALLAVALALVVIFPRLPKYGLFPAATLILGSSLILATGVYRSSLEKYEERGSEDTGRMAAWPLATELFLNNAATGVGYSNAAVPTPGRDIPTSPHNTFIFIALASGIVPLMFYLAYWVKAARRVITLTRSNAPSARYYLPLFIYCFVIANLQNYMYHWGFVVLAGLLTGYRRRPYKQAWRPQAAEAKARGGIQSRV